MHAYDIICSVWFSGEETYSVKTVLIEIVVTFSFGVCDIFELPLSIRGAGINLFFSYSRTDTGKKLYEMHLPYMIPKARSIKM